MKYESKRRKLLYGQLKKIKKIIKKKKEKKKKKNGEQSSGYQWGNRRYSIKVEE